MGFCHAKKHFKCFWRQIFLGVLLAGRGVPHPAPDPHWPKPQVFWVIKRTPFVQAMQKFPIHTVLWDFQITNLISIGASQDVVAGKSISINKTSWNKTLFHRH